MNVQLRERPDTEIPGVVFRVGFTTTRRIGNAVIRNRARRRLRSIVDSYASLLKFKKPVDLVFIATSTTSTAPFSALTSDFLYALKCLNILEDVPC